AGRRTYDETQRPFRIDGVHRRCDAGRQDENCARQWRFHKLTNIPDYSALMPAALITLPHLSSSACTNAGNSSGLLVSGSNACLWRGSRYSAIAGSLPTSPCTRVMIARGVAAGASSAYHEPTSTRRNPDSACVGTSG